MKIRVFALAMLFTLLSLVGGTLLSAPRHAEAAKSTGAAPTKIAITPAQSGGVLNGLFQVYQFAAQGGQVWAVGKYSGTVTNTTTGATQTVKNMAASAPVSNIDPSCTILTLTLGPLHLDLLGLVVDLNQVNLTITAQQGPGNLLGNLLCAVANLLNNNGGSLSGILDQIVTLLNQILAQL